MAKHHRYSAYCRACGATGTFAYMTVMNARVALCRACAADYIRAEALCDARAIDREREENAAAAERAGVKWSASEDDRTVSEREDDADHAALMAELGEKP